jgi:hypothetical protein
VGGRAASEEVVGLGQKWILSRHAIATEEIESKKAPQPVARKVEG